MGKSFGFGFQQVECELFTTGRVEALIIGIRSSLCKNCGKLFEKLIKI